MRLELLGTQDGLNAERGTHAQESTWTDIEMPGQYLAGGEVAQDAVVYLERIGANVAIVRRHATSVRRVELIGSDGKSRFFLVQSGQQWSNAHGATPSTAPAGTGHVLECPSEKDGAPR